MEPQDELTNDCISFLKSIGSNSTKISDIVDNKDKIIYKEIENGIKRANEFSTSRAAKVQKFAILHTDFSLVNGELGPTLKLRRPIVLKMYASIIDKLYLDNSME
jgi:long-chain-fatty-acid--CoA ligase ACSBG